MQNTTGLSLYVYFKRNECSDGVFSLAEDFSCIVTGDGVSQFNRVAFLVKWIQSIMQTA